MFNKQTLCPLCECNTPCRNLGRYKYKNALFANKNLYECTGCSFIFIHPMPSEEQLNDYYDTVWLKDESLISRSDGALLTRKIQARERVNYIGKYMNLSGSLKVLDIGSGDGYIFDELLPAMTQHHVFYAVEPNPDNRARLKAKNITTVKNLSNVQENTFDLIIMGFVLEHISNPIVVLKQVISKLKNGGYLFLDLPDRDFAFKDVYEPHVGFYTMKLLNYIADNVGLKIIHATGYGKKRKVLIKTRSIFYRIFNRIKNGLKRDSKTPIAVNEKMIYDCYRFDSEGPDRWWFRGILYKPQQLSVK